MPEEAKIDYESWAAGYRAAVCDLVPVPSPEQPAAGRNTGVIFGYVLGLLVAYLIYRIGEK